MSKNTTSTEGVEFAQLDPRSLVLGENARVDVTIDAELVASIAEHGVMQALTAYRDAEGRVVVLQGQRRTLAATQAGVPFVPVMIVPNDADDAERIVRQVEENDRRAAMTGVDRVAVAEQLALIGWTPDQIAKRTRRPVAEVTAALAVAKSSARDRMAEGLTLEQAAWLAEWADDPEATERLESALANDPGRMPHVVARLRADRAEADRLAEAVAKVAAVVTECDVIGDDQEEDVAGLGWLYDEKGQRITNAGHMGCPGNVAVVTLTAPWRLAHTPDAMPYSVRLGCRDRVANGHHSYSELHGQRETDQTQTREERAAIREGNAAWRAATNVRMEWLAKLAKAAKLPMGGAEYTAQAMATGNIADATGWAYLTGRTAKRENRWGSEYGEACEAIAKLTGPRAAVAALVMALAEDEKLAADVMTWRSPHHRTTRYLRQLEAWGYTLSEAEAALCTMTEQADADQ